MTKAYIGVGSNIDRRKHIEAAVLELKEIGQNIRLSTVYECEAVGFDGDAFYNLVIEMETSCDLMGFSQRLRNIELKWGREDRSGKLQSRTIDLDIILFGQHVSEKTPELPRSDIYKYGFVIEPLRELCAELTVPNDGRTIEQIWSELSYPETLTKIDLWF
ncbi:2-amino-4-hydroxy-6-hydroxymethyldihydropteridine diphosphokinase [Vibrio zhanjiangensis]|uniref:2-amino-4-hydroxy-6-hydroxymethyldihydropteridine diphosphokinase n=1 Tax=Vibrio zhanjiangensis TaxID=1046128 RepID=A0ABQ6F5P3_9VIBR|nr:2-amino-4-hydroxy-6-hydroxymethyldihydropteridine diphosphokinase [Vibrio zhanjiangensis]GLT20131.1 2-amino-4-hydroxy-6-hydroxymethyldihydropteridine diphosphokinase [Vibrio zhanjiangensis]